MVHPNFEKLKDKPIQVPDWIEPKIDDLDIIARSVMKITRHWVDWHIRALKDVNVHLTYYLMGNLDFHSDATKGSSQAQVEEGEIQQGAELSKTRTFQRGEG